MNFFKVNQCGLYRVGHKECYGIQLAETFDMLWRWAANRPMSTTLPWDAASLSSRSKAYLRDIYKDEETGDYLVVLWKSDANSSGGIWGAAEDGTIGEGEVVEYTNQYKGKKVIWGKPCYYWVIPKHDSVISIKFDHSVCDSQLFQDFIAGCITNRVDHPTRKKEKTERGAVRLSHSDPENPYNFSYRFEVSLRSLNTTNAALKKFAQSVTHIVKRETIQVGAKDERADWVKKFNESIPYVSAKPKSKHRQIEIKAEAKPTVEEMAGIIEKYAKEGRKSNEWDNVGFQGEKGIIWVDRYRLKDELVLNDAKSGVLPAVYLYEEISRNRSRYVTPISNEIEQNKIDNPDSMDEADVA